MKTELGTRPHELEVENHILRTKLWLARHGDELHSHLKDYHVKARLAAEVEAALYQQDIKYFDLSIRTWEEMPLCNFWRALPTIPYPIPYGFEIVKGSVRLTSKEISGALSKGRIDHTFLRSKRNGIILDHCPAQFVVGERNRGERLKHLMNYAPPLFYTLPLERGSEWTFLIAEASRVQNQLGIEYHDVPRRIE